jgi:hypothetical protein
MARTSNNAGEHPPANPADAVNTETPDIGVTPPQGGTAAANEGDLPEGPAPGPEDKIKVKHDGLKGAKITLPSGDIAAFDENGILEVDGKTAEYLLSIPGYGKG